ncbi:MAG: alkaline phosphatase PhoX [Acidimicrobiia bacterium]
MAQIDRRSFLIRGGAAAGGAVAATYVDSLSRAAQALAAPAAAGAVRAAGTLVPSPYGPLAPVPDQRGVEVLALPPEFSYVTFSRTGETMSDGTPVPRNHDGMGAFAGPGGTIRLIRNHENRNVPGDPRLAVLGPESTKYDRLAGGGTVSIDFDPRRQELVRHFVSLNGTTVNCAGGIYLRQLGWITCEETVAGPRQGWARPHGYCFLVPTSADGPVPAVPLPAMGRFAHEAVAQDLRTGFIYETEDSGNDSGFYRFRPANRALLTDGGTLDMLAVDGRPNYNTLTGQTVGVELPVRWVPIPDPDPDLESGRPEVAAQGLAAGGALFNRLEGIWFDLTTGDIFFCSTSGGNAGVGQVWRYEPRRETLTLFFESPGGTVLDSPDNLFVTPRGAILLCEDDATGQDADTHPLAPGITDVNRLIGLTRTAQPFEFAVNRLNDSEFAGACFGPDARTLFVNLFGGSAPASGMTCAITGPWHRGPL